MARNGMRVACALRSRRLARDPDQRDNHINACLRCQTEAVRYRTVRRHLAALRSELAPAPPGLVTAFVATSSHSEPALKKTPGVEAAVATAGLAAVAGAIAIWRRAISA